MFPSIEEDRTGFGDLERQLHHPFFIHDHLPTGFATSSTHRSVGHIQDGNKNHPPSAPKNRAALPAIEKSLIVSTSLCTAPSGEGRGEARLLSHSPPPLPLHALHKNSRQKHQSAPWRAHHGTNASQPFQVDCRIRSDRHNPRFKLGLTPEGHR